MDFRLFPLLFAFLIPLLQGAVTECPSEKCPDQGCRDEDTCECLTRKECEEKYENYGWIIYSIAGLLIFMSIAVLVYSKITAPRPRYLQREEDIERDVPIDHDTSQSTLVKSHIRAKPMNTNTSNVYRRRADKEMILRGRTPVSGNSSEYGYENNYNNGYNHEIITSAHQKRTFPKRYGYGDHNDQTTIVEEEP
mmetsp:Transcript_1236/g.1303  ORF Transcript_1236/g.1303 Transcript_1236/m.1303 type:complete len:194 (-) Transcript_1236:233-814(-)